MSPPAPAREVPLAEEMRSKLSFLAGNLEEVFEGYVGRYEVNAARVQLLDVFALTTEIDVLEAKAKVSP